MAIVGLIAIPGDKSSVMERDIFSVPMRTLESLAFSFGTYPAITGKVVVRSLAAIM